MTMEMEHCDVVHLMCVKTNSIVSETKCCVPRNEFSNTSYTWGTLPKLFVNFFFRCLLPILIFIMSLSPGQKW